MSGAPTRVFIARLAGITVFDPNAEPVGKVRDVVVTLRIGRQAPRVLGLVVEVLGRRRVFLPMTLVLLVGASATLLAALTLFVPIADLLSRLSVD